jgi:hypothetical protein
LPPQNSHIAKSSKGKFKTEHYLKEGIFLFRSYKILQRATNATLQISQAIGQNKTTTKNEKKIR